MVCKMMKWVFFLFVYLLSINSLNAQYATGQSDPNTWDASKYPGADICAKITNAAIAAKALSPNGATIDARNIIASGNCASPLYTGWPSPFPAIIVFGPLIPSSIGTVPANVSLVYTIPGTGSSSQPITLVDGATIPVPCPGPNNSVTYYLTLTGSNHQILFPTCPIDANGQSVKFRINSGNNSGSTYSGLTFASGYAWTNNSPYAICTAAATPNPACPGAETANQIDWFGCDVVGTGSGSTEWDCWSPQYKVVPTAFTFISSNSCIGANCTTSATNMTGANLLVGCISDFSSNAALIDSLGNSYTPVYSTVSAGAKGVLAYSQTTNVSSSMTFSLSGGSFSSLAVMGFSGAVPNPLDQFTGTAATGNPVTTISPGSKTPTQANELLVSCLALNGTNTTTNIAIASPFTLGPVIEYISGANEGVAAAYQIQTVATAQNPAWTWTTPSDAVAGLATFK